MPEPQSDFSAIQNPPGPGDTPEMQNLQQALGNMREFQSKLVIDNQINEQVLPPQSLQFNPGKGTVTMKDLPMATYEAYNRDRQQLNEIRGSFALEAQRLKNQEDSLRNQSPWIQLATALAGNLATQKDMPGWVQGMGKTAQQLNPMPDQIRNQRMAVLGEQANITEKTAGLDIAQQRTLLENQRENRLLTTGQANQSAKTFAELSDAAQKGELTDIPLTSQVLQNAGHPKERADAEAAALVGVSKEKKAMLAAAAAATDKRTSDALKERARESDARMAVMLKTLAVKTSDKEDSKKALEETAQSLASGDLTAIRQISSLRTGERTKLYARIKELNPQFNTAEVDRKIKMLDSFEVGKDRIAIQSFDTFLQHAGEVTETLKGIQLTDQKLLNKSINWWRKNMKGTPELARLETSLEPVGKEFESFLLNQRALYDDDRKQIKELLDQNTPLVAVMATLNQMGKTAKDRYAAMNQQYKRVMKQDIEDPFSEEAKAAAAKIGIALPTGKGSTPQGAKQYPWEK